MNKDKRCADCSHYIMCYQIANFLTATKSLTLINVNDVRFPAILKSIYDSFESIANICKFYNF